MPPPRALDRRAALSRWRDGRRRSRTLFDLVDERWYDARPIALRNPIVFYEGHLPAFAVNTLLKKGLGRRGVDARLEEIFARGIDPADEKTAVARGGVSSWPARRDVLRFAEACDELIERALDDPATEGLEHVGTILEHEEMHHETLLYMLHRLPLEAKSRPPGYAPPPPRGDGPRPRQAVMVPAGEAELGAPRAASAFGWDNEFEAHAVHVPAFTLDPDDVTNDEFRSFVEETGAAPPPFWERHDGAWYQRGQFDLLPLPPDWPVYTTQRQAQAYAAWRGARLMTEAEWHRAADVHGDEGDARAREDAYDPAPVGSAGGRLRDLSANGWEWTATPFAPFPGFRPMPSYPEYSADFFDGAHVVLKGASPVTAAGLVRRSFRNWFRPDYPYVYATFRCARDARP